MMRLCGAALGLLAFGVTILSGLAAGNSTEATLLKAVWAMVVFFLLGCLVGWMACRVIDEHAVHRHEEMFKEEGDDNSETGDPEQREQQKQGNAPPTAEQRGVRSPREKVAG